jgi:hypothetical protein
LGNTHIVENFKDLIIEYTDGIFTYTIKPPRSVSVMEMLGDEIMYCEGVRVKVKLG